MANTAYPLGMQSQLAGDIDLLNDTISVALFGTGYTYSASHQYANQLGTIIGTAQDLAGKSTTGGVFDATDINFGAIAAGSAIKGFALFKNTGNLSTSPLLLYADTATGLPVTTTGGEFQMPWSDDAKKILRLALPFYPKGGEKVLNGDIDWLDDDIMVRLLPSSYTYSDTHEFLNQVSAGIGTDQTLAGKSIANGIFDANDAPFGALAGGSIIGSILLYKNTGVPSTSPVLLRFSDTVGLPMATNGAEYTQKWSNATSRIFRLG